MCLSTAAFLPRYIKNHTPTYYGRVSLSKNLYRYQKWGLGRSPKQGEGGSPTLSPFPRGRGLGIGKDAEIERPKALQDAKPTKRSYRNREFAIFFKNKLFLQADTPIYYGRVVFS